MSFMNGFPQDSHHHGRLDGVASSLAKAGTRLQLTQKIFPVDDLIDSNKDVALLLLEGIVLNFLQYDKAAVKLFTAIAKEMTPDSIMAISYSSCPPDHIAIQKEVIKIRIKIQSTVDQICIIRVNM
ncbi:hypothetical protein MLD38_007393 [Melastoma candidum]|uniref:Uncharacterized protein n=1 Tax=Melastoma candidum TaxID=119954 RepID=A0ACB9RQQ0_9MYRT|nr:hypothetical protein MLD38_007393 [Melastoma candidum]